MARTDPIVSAVKNGWGSLLAKALDYSTFLTTAPRGYRTYTGLAVEGFRVSQLLRHAALPENLLHRGIGLYLRLLKVQLG